MAQKSTQGSVTLTYRWVYTVHMIGTREQVTDELIFCIALRHLGAEREVLVVKEREQEFFAFPPYAKKPLGSFDVHMSWHKSGERHFTVRLLTATSGKNTRAPRRRVE